VSNLFNIINFTDLNKLAISNGQIFITYNDLKNKINYYSAVLESNGLIQKKVLLKTKCEIEQICMYLAIIKTGNIAVLSNDENFYNLTSIDFELKESQKRSTKEILTYEYIYDDTPSTILLTSGSIQKKAVVISHKLQFNVRQTYSENGKNYKVLSNTPIYHMNGLCNVLSVLHNGGTIYLNTKYSKSTFIKLINNFKINVIICIPTMINFLENELRFEFVKLVSLTSAPSSQSVINKARKIFPNASVKLGYGLTELGSRLFGKHPNLPTPELSVGYPIEGIKYRIKNDILEIQHPNIFIKYENSSFLPMSEDGYFITNDKFFVDENGFYYFAGRSDDVFAFGGYKINPYELEEIINRYDGIKLSAIIPIPSDYKDFVPYLCLLSNENFEMKVLENFLDKNIPKTHRPKKIIICSDFPMTHTGKVDRNKLIEIIMKAEYVE